MSHSAPSSPESPTSINANSFIANALKRQREAYNNEPMPSLQQRIQHLKTLKRALLENRPQLIEAISADFKGRSSDETQLAEILPSVGGINHTIRHLKRWMKAKRRFAGLQFLPASAKVIYQPLGVVGIVVPWNYPLFLAIGPMTSAMAAGNRIMVKMSEFTPRTSELFASMMASYFSEDTVTVINGDAEVAAAFSQQAFDHLLFTGATSIGRHVMRAASENLTPVTLELGGKSPGIIGDDIAIEMAAERICFGKSLNAGQTCVAPDYVLVPQDKQQAFIDAYQASFKRMYPAGSIGDDYSSIINQRQLGRLQTWLADAEQKGAQTIALSDDVLNESRRLMAPRLITNCSDEMTLMQEEIFGPLLPIIPYNSLDEAISYVQQRDRPLALYYFGHNKDDQQKVLEQTHSGGICINETLFHVAVDDIPFGGVGPSGMGHYHGHEGFLTFSQAKGVLSKGKLSSSKLIFPPYNKWINKLIYWIFIR